jgi:hypothetical protein
VILNEIMFDPVSGDPMTNTWSAQRRHQHGEPGRVADRGRGNTPSSNTMLNPGLRWVETRRGCADPSGSHSVNFFGTAVAPWLMRASAAPDAGRK